MNKGKNQWLSAEKLAYIALLVAVQVVLGNLFEVPWTEKKQFNFGFLPIAVSGALFGPIPAMIVGALGDVIGAHLFPRGAYFVGFTLSQILVGFLYSLALCKRKPSFWRIFTACVAVSCLYLFLNSYWLHLMYGVNYWVYIGVRWWMYLVEIPVTSLVIYSTLFALSKQKLPVFAVLSDKGEAKKEMESKAEERP